MTFDFNVFREPLILRRFVVLWLFSQILLMGLVCAYVHMQPSKQRPNSNYPPVDTNHLFK